MNQKTIGIFAILLTALMWAIEPIVAKLSYYNSDFLHATSIRSIVVAAVALIYIFFTNRGNLKVSKKQFSILLVIALVATCIAELIFLYAISKSAVVNVVVVAHMQPVFIVLLGYFFLKKDRLNWFDYAGMSFMIVAGIMVTTKNIQNLAALKLLSSTDLLVLFSAFLWAITSLLTKKYLQDINAGVIAFYRYSIGSLILGAYLFFNSSFMIANKYQIILGIVIGVGIILYYESIKRLKVAQAGALELTSPFFASILGYIFFKETITIMQFLGILLMFVGVYFLSRKEA